MPTKEKPNSRNWEFRGGGLFQIFGVYSTSVEPSTALSLHDTVAEGMKLDLPHSAIDRWLGLNMPGFPRYFTYKGITKTTGQRQA